MRFFASLRRALALYFLAIATLPMCLLGVVGFGYFERTQFEAFSENVNVHLNNLQRETSDFLHANSLVLILIEDALSSGVLHNDDKIMRFLQLTVANAANFESIYLLNSEHRITHFGLSRDQVWSEDYLALDMSGHEIFSPGKRFDQLIWSETFISALTGEPSVTLALPLESGALLGTISLEQLGRVLTKQLDGSNATGLHFSLVDRYGMLLADSRPGRAEQRINLSSYPPVREAMKNPQPQQLPLGQWDQTTEELYSIGRIPQTGWIAYVSIPVQQIFQAGRPLHVMLLGALLGASLLGILLSLWLSRRVLKPILVLQETTRAVAEGDYSLSLPAAKYVELESFGDNFRSMVEAVQDRERSLTESRTLYQEMNEHLRVILDRMPLGCVTWDLDFKVKHWNPAAEEIFGFSREEALGRTPFGFILPMIAEESIHNVWERLMSGDGMSHNINENLTKSGQMITCEWHNTPLYNIDGKMSGVLSMAQNVSQRVAAEKALVESENSFRTIFQTNPDAVMVVRATDGRILNVNDNCLALSGYVRDEVIGKTTQELNLWNDPALIHNYLARVNDEGAVNNFEMEVRRRDGRVRIGLVSARTLQLGEEPCRMVVIRDITAMKDAERRALRSESRFRSLVSVMGEGVLILSKDGDIIQSNQAAEKILDVSREEMLDRDYLDVVPEVIHEDGRPCSLDERPTSVTLQTGEPVVNQVFGFNAKSGKTVWLQFNTHALGVDSKGKPQAMVISFADVTRLKQIENDLRRNEQHLRTVSQQLQGLLRAIPDRIMVLDRNMRVVWLNWVERERETLLDDAEAYEGRLCYKIDMMHCGRAGEEADDVCGFARCPVQKCFRSGHPEILQKSMSDGRTLQLRAFPVNDEQGDIINVIEIVQDITEELRAQEQNVRTGQLAALGELAAGVAHEINNPINGVINYAQLILNKAEETSREQELSQRIIREGERIAVIVRELLFFAREESQEVHQVTVLSVLEEVLTLTRNQIRKESIKMQVDLPDDLPPIDSRSHQIQQLFLNLISNARHALSEKYPSKDPNKILRVSAEPIERESQNFVRICFRDHGTGIPPELLPRVLNPFVTTKPSGVGTGLGLSISHEIVQKHGGTLTIGSEEGEYTELIVELPASKVVDSELEGM